MRVSVRIQVRWERTHQCLEMFQLALEFDLYGVRGAAAEIGMQPHAQRRSFTSQHSRFIASGEIDQKAGAREDPVTVRFENAAIDPVARPQVVSIDNQVFHSPIS
jgi:hypothetical protein